MEIEFRRPELEDRELINSHLAKQFSRSCEQTFANTYLWSRHYNVVFTVIDDTLVFKTNGENPAFTYPIGSPEGVKAALDTMIKYCEEAGIEFRMYNITEGQFASIEEFYPDKFQIEYDRDVADYVYETEKLATLAGKKYHSKRNHINRFLELYPNWSYEPMSEENIEDCFQMALKWREENDCEGDEEKTAEMCVTLNYLRLFRELEVVGGVLRIDGKVAAFTIGEAVCSDTLVVHVEKAFAEIQGAYPMINKEFVAHEALGKYEYVNREEDTGAEGLRKAKLSYRPVFLVEKGRVTLKKNRENE
jgi:hypothetical protein